MCISPRHLIPILLLAAVLISPGAGVRAQCFGSLVLAPSYFEFDYLVRIAVHFGNADDLPQDVICSKSRLPGEQIVEVPLWFYNVHEGATYLEFGVESNDSIVGFAPADCISIGGESLHNEDGIYVLNLMLDACGPICGPAMAGRVLIKFSGSSDITWINIVPNGDTGRMYALDQYYEEHSMFSPNHGGYIGTSYLYTCQRPICEEPNLPVEAMDAVAGYGLAVRLTWIAGGGNNTLIRARTDRFPTGYGDGRLVAIVPGSLGQSQYYYDTAAPQGEIVYYKAFSLTMGAGGEILENSFVECASSDTTFTHGFISTKESSWGSIKKLMR